jgi:hypothetical protein
VIRGGDRLRIGTRLMALAILSWAPVTLAGPYLGATLSADGGALTIETRQGPRPAPVLVDGQAGFAQPQVSRDGNFVGWMTLEEFCCASYPIPFTLVVLGPDNNIVRFDEAPPIWAWAFADGGTTVVYRQRFPHGLSPVIYKRWRLRDHKLLGQFECAAGEAEKPAAAVGRVPAWVWPIAEECPVRPAPAAGRDD